MSTDWYTKLVLTVIAASAAVLALQQLDGAPPAGEARFRLQAIPMARMLIRLDGETGKTWTTSLQKPETWQEIAESPLETLDDVKPPAEDVEADEVEDVGEVDEAMAPEEPTP